MEETFNVELNEVQRTFIINALKYDLVQCRADKQRHADILEKICKRDVELTAMIAKLEQLSA